MYQKDDGQLQLPDEDTERQMYYLTNELLKQAGYERYEISNYSKPGYESKHNMSYWKRKEYLGFGASAASYIDNERYTSICNVEEYIKFVNLTKDDEEYLMPKSQSCVLSKTNKMEESIFLGLRLMKGIIVDDFEKEFGCSIQSVYGEVIKKYVDMGCMEMSSGILKLTEKGIDVSNSIFADFIV